MTPDLEKRIARLAADRESGASEIVIEAVAILRDAIAREADVPAVVHALRQAQPSMAPVWNATAAALAGDLDRFTQRLARAPDAIARFAVGLLDTGGGGAEGPPHSALAIVTLSYSATVAHALESLARRRSVRVACGEGRPALEGRWLAARLAAASIPVTLYLDGAIGHALEDAHAVLLGADAVTPTWFMNKSGTRMLAASAAARGVPVYVAAGREKFAAPAVAAQLTVRDGPPSEVWWEPPPGVSPANPYFEQTPLDLVSALITDAGVISSSDVVQVCESGAYMSY